MCKIWWQSVQPFSSVPRFLNFWPTKTPQNAPWDMEGLIVLAYVHSQMNPQACTKFGANWSTRLGVIPDFWISDPLKTPKMPPGGIEGLIVFSLCTFPDESAGVYQIWCQLVHPFGSYSRFLNFWPPKSENPPPPNPPWVTRADFYLAHYHLEMNLHVCAKFGPDRTTGDDVYTVGRIHTQTDRQTDRHTHTLLYRYR